jgi:NAD(P)-dependent dehydrogenase (short-subunit alcohol dehydrogenase family)
MSIEESFLMSANILITGANRGLGLAIAQQFLARRDQVFALVRHHGGALNELQQRYPDRLHAFPADVTDETSVSEAVASISERVDHLDIIVNNAAVHLEQSAPLIEQVDFSGYLYTFQVNAIGPLKVVKHALPLLRRGERNLIANISSEAGSISASQRRSEYSYCMSKAALNMASKLLQNSLKDEGIKVLAIHPGWFSSDMGGPAAPITPADAAEVLVNTLLQPHELSGPVYVASDGRPMSW